jgi:endonuclease YncB( thermonuclease family)
MPVASAACRGEAAGGGPVRSIIDGRSFVLADGREIRLAGIEVPLMPTAGETGARALAERQAGEAARTALAGIIAERMVELRQPPDGIDRYGRTLAFAQLGGEGGPSVAHALLARGFARVAAQVGNLACAAELWRQERTAREAKLGLWGEAYYAIRGANDRAGLVAELGQFVLVEGRVASVRESGGTLYVNFGRQWSQALTVTISRRNERTFAATGLEPRQLEGRRVRVRGFMEERSGPRIEATRAEQIEIAER